MSVSSPSRRRRLGPNELYPGEALEFMSSGEEAATHPQGQGVSQRIGVGESLAGRPPHLESELHRARNGRDGDRHHNGRKGLKARARQVDPFLRREDAVCFGEMGQGGDGGVPLIPPIVRVSPGHLDDGVGVEEPGQSRADRTCRTRSSVGSSDSNLPQMRLHLTVGGITTWTLAPGLASNSSTTSCGTSRPIESPTRRNVASNSGTVIIIT